MPPAKSPRPWRDFGVVLIFPSVSSPTRANKEKTDGRQDHSAQSDGTPTEDRQAGHGSPSREGRTVYLVDCRFDDGDILIGFDEVILCEEGRHHLGGDEDDFERFLKAEGYAGQELTHAMGNNVYDTRPWHLPEHCHPTNWTVREMCRVIQRRDPTRPAFWYCSFIAPHPPVVPPRDYFDLYHRLGVDEPFDR